MNDDPSTPDPKVYVPVLILIAIAVVIGLAATHGFGGIDYAGNIGDQATKVVTSLLVVTIFVERSTAVLASMWFGPQITEARADAAVAAVSEGAAAVAAAKKLIAMLAAQQNQARQFFALVIAALVAVVGPRTLEMLLVSPLPTKVTGAPLEALYAVDMLITAGLIAGGSDGIHDIALLLAKILSPPTPPKPLGSSQ